MMTDEGHQDRNPIEVIADEFVDRLRRGEHPTVEEYAARHPEIHDDIVELLPTVVTMEALKRQKEDTDRSRFLRGPGSLTKLGDFLILGEIGRGGMGIVYEAEQQSLGRHVAVKVLPRQSLLDEHRLDRFEREAKTTARLHHTNIVPIFGVGEQDGYHYYVMQFIRGLGLDRVVRELRGDPPRNRLDGSRTSLSDLAKQAAGALRDGRFPDRPPPSEDDSGLVAPPEVVASSTAPHRGRRSSVDNPFWRSVAGVGMQVADALTYAHSHGTLHRDIKPANLLLDGQGVVWVTDFGLAKAIEDNSITNSGDVVGTLQYMAPEQFCGSYDARSDIYCLGLTLYELLTLQPAYHGTNRSGLIQKVTAGTPTPPRRIEASIPPDLETIILKSISREPAHRYQTAAELRDDLQRFLEDRPIKAQRTNLAQQVWRWYRRNRALASALCVAALAVLTATFVGWASFVREAERGRETTAVNQRLGKHLDLNWQFFERIFQRLVGPDVYQSMIRVETGSGSELEATADSTVPDYQSVSIPTVSQRDAEVLEELLAFYEAFSQQNTDQSDVRFDSAAAHHHRGDILLRLGQLEKATKAYLKAIQEYKRQPAGDCRQEIASVRNQLGQVYANQQMIDTARVSFRLVVEALEDDTNRPRFPEPRWRYELARAHDFLGSLGIDQVEQQMDERARRRSRGRRGPPSRWRGPSSGRHEPVATRRPSHRHDQPMRMHEIPDLQIESRHRHHEAAQRLLDQLSRTTPKPEYLLAKARSCRNYAGFLTVSRSLPRTQTAQQPDRNPRDLITAAVVILERLVKDHPDAPHYEFELAETLAAGRPVRRGSSPEQLAARADYRARLARSELILRDLHRRFPTLPSYAEGLARTLHARHRALMRHDDRETGRALLVEAIALLEQLRRRLPENRTYLIKLARMRRPYADLLVREVEFAGPWLAPAIDQLDRSIAELLAYQRAGGDEWLAVHALVGHYRFLSELLYRRGDESRGDRQRADAARASARGLAERYGH